MKWWLFFMAGIFGRKFWNLLKLNMMFFIFNLPALINYSYDFVDLSDNRDHIVFLHYV